jgi:hypothetical protein
MSSLSADSNLKEINAHKKKINWGDVPAIYHMVSSSIGDLDGILTHGFDSAYKKILNPNFWNLPLFSPYKDQQNNLQVKNKPEIYLRHEYNDMGYELHLYPVVDGQIIKEAMINHPRCPFTRWHPESMQMLFRINSLVSFNIFCYQSGDEADLALIKYAYFRVNKLIDTLSESFHIVEVKGYNIAQFYQEIVKRNGNILNPEAE